MFLNVNELTDAIFVRNRNTIIFPYEIISSDDNRAILNPIGFTYSDIVTAIAQGNPAVALIHIEGADVDGIYLNLITNYGEEEGVIFGGIGGTSGFFMYKLLHPADSEEDIILGWESYPDSAILYVPYTHNAGDASDIYTTTVPNVEITEALAEHKLIIAKVNIQNNVWVYLPYIGTTPAPGESTTQRTYSGTLEDKTGVLRATSTEYKAKLTLAEFLETVYIDYTVDPNDDTYYTTDKSFTAVQALVQDPTKNVYARIRNYRQTAGLTLLLRPISILANSLVIFTAPSYDMNISLIHGVAALNPAFDNYTAALTIGNLLGYKNVKTDNINDSAVSEVKLASAAVSESKIAPGAVTANKLHSSTIPTKTGRSPLDLSLYTQGSPKVFTDINDGCYDVTAGGWVSKAQGSSDKLNALTGSILIKKSQDLVLINEHGCYYVSTDTDWSDGHQITNVELSNALAEIQYATPLKLSTTKALKDLSTGVYVISDATHGIYWIEPDGHSSIEVILDVGALVYVYVDTDVTPNQTHAIICDSWNTTSVVINKNTGRAITQGKYITDQQCVAYSTNERVVGTWVDGKPLYEITITGTLGTNNTEYIGFNTDPTDTSNTLNIKEFIDIQPRFYKKHDNGTYHGSELYNYYYGTVTYRLQINSLIEYDTNPTEPTEPFNNAQLVIAHGSDYNNADYIITVRYTKTTDYD